MNIQITDVVFRGDGEWVIAKTTEGTTVKGVLPGCREGSVYEVEGEEKQTKYGPTFAIRSQVPAVPKSVDAIESFLLTIPGIGPAMAKRIVETYGEDSLDMLRDSPGEVAKNIPRMSATVADTARDYLLEKHMEIQQGLALRAVLSSVPEFVIRKAIARWGGSAAGWLRDNPYMLMDLEGVGWEIADRVAKGNGILHNDPARLKAAVHQARRELSNQGWTIFPAKDILSRAALIADAEGGTDQMLQHLPDNLILREEDDCIIYPPLESDELFIAERIAERVEPLVDDGELVPDMTEDQSRAIRMFESAQVTGGRVMILTGGPGTGKTYTVNTVLDRFKGKGSIKLLAPTGKAARRLAEVTGHDASTIHRGLEAYIEAGVWKFRVGPSDPLDEDLVVVDEFSMVDTRMARAVIGAVHPKSMLLIVGDKNQLPSVGPGSVLRDLIASKVPMAELTTIKRQEDGGITRLCEAIMRCEIGEGVWANEDLHLMQKHTADGIFKLLTELRVGRLDDHAIRLNLDPMRDIQILTPRAKKHQLGADRINQAIQVARGTGTEGFPEKGDRVICTANDYERSVFNGDQATVQEVSGDKMTVRLDHEDRTTIVPRFTGWQLGYAISIHKSQGSEWPIVVVPVHSSMSNMLTRGLLYTACSRAKQMLVLVGSKDAIHNASRNLVEQRRVTGLISHIKAATKRVMQ